MYDIFYFHGLDSFLSDAKRKILEKFGNLTAPTFNYRDGNYLNNILDSFDDANMESTVLIGSSFGGYVANMLSVAYDISSLVFNPALSYRTFDLESGGKQFPNNIKSLAYIVLGKKDTVVRFKDNLDFISEHLKGPKKVR